MKLNALVFVFTLIAECASADTTVAVAAGFIWPLAVKLDGKWSVAETAKVTRWWSAYDGKSRGEVRSKPADPQPYSEFQNIHSAVGKVPYVGAPTTNEGGEKEYRPLVLVSAPNFKDPDGWKRGTAPPKARDAVRAEYRKKYPKAEDCSENDEAPPVEYADSEVKIRTVYISKNGNLLIEADLDRIGCSSLNGESYDRQWFAVTEGTKVQFLDRRMTLVDAGDYDGDGRSEIIFDDRSDGGDDDNARGFSLWSADFKALAKRVRYLH